MRKNEQKNEGRTQQKRNQSELPAFLGAKALYIFALPEDKLIQYYQEMGFTRLSEEKEKYVHSQVLPPKTSRH